MPADLRRRPRRNEARESSFKFECQADEVNTILFAQSHNYILEAFLMRSNKPFGPRLTQNVVMKVHINVLDIPRENDGFQPKILPGIPPLHQNHLQLNLSSQSHLHNLSIQQPTKLQSPQPKLIYLPKYLRPTRCLQAKKRMERSWKILDGMELQSCIKTKHQSPLLNLQLLVNLVEAQFQEDTTLKWIQDRQIPLRQTQARTSLQLKLNVVSTLPQLLQSQRPHVLQTMMMICRIYSVLPLQPPIEQPRKSRLPI